MKRSSLKLKYIIYNFVFSLVHSNVITAWKHISEINFTVDFLSKQAASFKSIFWSNIYYFGQSGRKFCVVH